MVNFIFSVEMLWEDWCGTGHPPLLEVEPMNYKKKRENMCVF